MPLRPLARIVLHLLLAVLLVTPGLAAPAQALASELAAAAAMAMADGMAGQDMPCADMGEPADASTPPCDCCTPHDCDLSACLGTACLPTLARIAVHIPPSASRLPWQQPSPPSRMIDSPLRPPIA